MTSELQHYSLPRTGAPHLAFEGELLAGAYGEEVMEVKRRNPRWHDIELFRTKGGKYVLSIRYRAEWRDEPGDDRVMVLDSPEEVRRTIIGWDALAPVRGYPPGEPFREKQERLLADVKLRFDLVVSDLFAQLGPEYAERVE